MLGFWVFGFLALDSWFELYILGWTVIVRVLGSWFCVMDTYLGYEVIITKVMCSF